MERTHQINSNLTVSVEKGRLWTLCQNQTRGKMDMSICFIMEIHQSQSRQTEKGGSSDLLDEGEAIGSDQLHGQTVY